MRPGWLAAARTSAVAVAIGLAAAVSGCATTAKAMAARERAGAAVEHDGRDADEDSYAPAANGDGAIRLPPPLTAF